MLVFLNQIKNFSFAINKSGAKIENSLMIGDDEISDIRGARI